MSLTREEQEIHIAKSANEDEFSVYITDPIYVRRMKKIGIEPFKVDLIGDEEVAFYYKIPKKQISFKKKTIKRELTEEQKEDLRLRAINMRNNKKIIKE